MKLGRPIYEKFCSYIGNHPQWQLLPANHREAWDAAADEAISAQRMAESRTLSLFEEPVTGAKRGPKRVVGYKELMTVYTECFKTKFLKLPVYTPSNGKAAKDMLIAMSLEDATTCVRMAFEDKWFVENGCPMSSVLANSNRYLTKDCKPVANVSKPQSIAAQQKPDYR